MHRKQQSDTFDGGFRIQMLGGSELLAVLSDDIVRPERCNAFKEHLLVYLGEGRCWIIIDMHHVDFINSRLLGVLVHICHIARERGGDVMLVDATPDVSQILRLTMMDRFFRVLNSIAAARLRVIETSIRK